MNKQGAGFRSINHYQIVTMPLQKYEPDAKGVKLVVVVYYSSIINHIFQDSHTTPPSIDGHGGGDVM